MKEQQKLVNGSVGEMTGNVSELGTPSDRGKRMFFNGMMSVEQQVQMSANDVSTTTTTTTSIAVSAAAAATSVQATLNGSESSRHSTSPRPSQTFDVSNKENLNK